MVRLVVLGSSVSWGTRNFGEASHLKPRFNVSRRETLKSSWKYSPMELAGGCAVEPLPPAVAELLYRSRSR